MRRRIELWIAGTQADLSDQSLVLFNYAYTDLENPTAVRNSYSQQVTLPGTPTNNEIFGHLYRPDRRAASGFNPLTRTEFTIYNEAGEILKSGYLKLDNVARKGGIVTGWKVSLYGGLGSFLYALSYDDSGNKLTLADLDYLGEESGQGTSSLDFIINAENVIEAWSRLDGSPFSTNPLWDVINFAPAYNGIPEGDFSADKAIAYYTNIGVASSVTDGDKTYTTNGGYVLVNLAEKHTEWDCHDLRCYLQRPVLSMRAFLVAIQRWATRNGYTFDYSDIPESQYRDLWKTLPMIPSLGSFKQTSGSLTATYTTGTTSAGDTLYGSAYFSGVQSSMEVTASLNSAMLAFRYSAFYGSPMYTKTRWHASNTANEFGYMSVVFVQLLGYNGNVLVAYSPVRCIAPDEMVEQYGAPAALAEAVGFTPYHGQEYEGNLVQSNYFFTAGDATGYFQYNYLSPFNVKGTGITTLRLAVKSILLYGTYKYKGGTIGQVASYEPFKLISTQETGMAIKMWPDPNPTGTTGPTTRTATGADWSSPSASASYRSTDAARSGALVEKAKLLSSKHTPADYLLSLALQFGWVFRYDEVAKRLTLTTRNTFFNTGKDAIDLTARVDRSREITISPCYAGARVYEFAQEMAQGHFAAEYASTYGVEYGIQRVDTGYQFDSTPENLLARSAFRAAATILEHGPYWTIMRVNGSRRPSVLIDKGNTYTLWASDGTNKQIDIPVLPNDAVVDYINDEYHPGYDSEFAWKLDLHDADGKGLDGEDILVYFSGMDSYDGFGVSDDLYINLNNNKPCWVLAAHIGGIRIANFHRYDTNTEWRVEASLDFGTPREVDIPTITFSEDSPGYVRAWAAFIRDRYHRDTKVMKCRVDLSGLQVNQELLRRFFYYEGSYWVLNKINNYSLTTWDPVECEFIQVQDMENYTNGQILD